MSCCGSTDRIGQIAGTEKTTAMPADVAAIADPTPPSRSRFMGGRSHTGTRNPALPQDGEGILREHRLKPFEAEQVLVTNARFAAFVKATGHVTVAERFGWGMVFRGLLDDPNSVAPGGGGTPWWGAVDGACWFAPEGPASSAGPSAFWALRHAKAGDVMRSAASR